MNDKRRLRISKYMSKHLRHSPEAIGLELQPGGWVMVSDLICGAFKDSFEITQEEVEHVVKNCDKQRFALDESKTRIRANQGHSTEVELELEQVKPPKELFHGTAERNLEAILQQGLLKMARHHVHLSLDKATALKVGQRHGKPSILVVDADRMAADGHIFFRSANGVWLVDSVAPQYLRLLTSEEQ